MLLSIIVQVYNERHTLGTISDIVARTLPNVSKEVIVVDDCSSDIAREWLKVTFPDGARTGSLVNVESEGHLAFAQELGPARITIRPIFHERDRGTGGVVQTGFAAISGDVVVIQDVGLEYDPSDWQPMYDLIAVRKVVDVVFRSREPVWKAHRHISTSAPPIAALPFSILSLVCFLVNLCLCALAAMTVLLLGNAGDIVVLIAGAGLVAALLSKFARGKYRVSSR